MFLVGQLGATINADRKPFDRTLDSVFRDGGRQMKALGSRMTAALTLPLLGAGALAIKTASDYETLRVSMDTLNGSAQEGARNFERLKRFSAGTPFQLQDLASAQNMLQGFGMAADDAFESIKMIGDISAVSGGSINDIGIAFGQAAAEGRLMTRDIRQLINQGVPAIKLLADTMGVAQSEVLELASQGEISFEILQQSFKDATTEGGMFANGMQKQSQTIGGLFSTLRDNLSLALGDIGNSLADTFDIRGLIADLTEHIQTGIDWFNSLSDETRRMAFTIAGLLGAGGPILMAIGTLSIALGAISAPVLAATAAVALGATTMISNWSEVEEYFTSGGGKTMWTDLQATVREIVDVMTKLWESFGDDLIEITKFLMGKILETIENIVWATSLLAKAANITVDAFKNVGDAFNSVFGDGEKKLRESTRSMEYLFESSKKLSDFINTDFNTGFSRSASSVSSAKDSIDELAESMERVSVAASRPESNIIDPSEIANAQMMRNEFREFDNVLLDVMTHSEDFSHRFEQVTGEGQKSAEAMMGLANSVGTIFDQAALGGEKLIGVVSNLLKQLASRAFVTGLGALLTGGTSLGGSSFLGAVFGGFRSNGGPAMAGRSYVVGENGREVFTPSTNGSVTPVSGGGMNLSPSQMKQAFSMAFRENMSRLGPNEFYMLTQIGRRDY